MHARSAVSHAWGISSIYASSSKIAFRHATHFRLSSLSTPSRRLLCAVPPGLTHLNTAEDHELATQWCDAFRRADPMSALPQGLIKVTFNRSSGPGGQNVNKVNSKATLRLDLQQQTGQSWAPDYVVRALAHSPLSSSNGTAVVLACDSERTQRDNLRVAHERLHKLVLDAAQRDVKRPTSAATQERVEKLVKVGVAKRKEAKQRQSAKRSARKLVYD
ncbi:hypothetical protein E5Q_06042 [Mixia osmundae IAM 14324]|uniref:Prokaryotic-type class I peptide chain release factors domain-containing protein n=1 Tax=Mixia osmundae (strain CBS 9802 / IAM 14324 / JCM 22182 / KY 12970) TaxID=764103 RepID=G7E9M8_MIXOS|nr:hypothetical protein E5Q_06042 [Mixia osmundae IAM 14324]